MEELNSGGNNVSIDRQCFITSAELDNHLSNCSPVKYSVLRLYGFFQPVWPGYENPSPFVKSGLRFQPRYPSWTFSYVVIAILFLQSFDCNTGPSFQKPRRTHAPLRRDSLLTNQERQRQASAIRRPRGIVAIPQFSTRLKLQMG